MARDDYNLFERMVFDSNMLFSNALEWGVPGSVRKSKANCDKTTSESTPAVLKAQCDGIEASFCQHYPEDSVDHGLGTTSIPGGRSKTLP